MSTAQTIHDARTWESLFSKNRLLGEGFLYGIDSAIFGLGAGASRTLYLENNSTDPVLILQLNVLILSDKGDHEISLFSGGTISGGSAIPQIPQSAIDLKPSPFGLALDGVTIDVPGNSLGVFEGSFSRLGGYLYNAPNFAQYITVTNSAGQASTGIQVQMLAARIVK